MGQAEAPSAVHCGLEILPVAHHDERPLLGQFGFGKSFDDIRRSFFRREIRNVDQGSVVFGRRRRRRQREIIHIHAIGNYRDRWPSAWENAFHFFGQMIGAHNNGIGGRENSTNASSLKRRALVILGDIVAMTGHDQPRARQQAQQSEQP